MAQVGNKIRKIYVTHINIRQSIFFLVLKLVLLDGMFAVSAVLYFFAVSNNFVSGFLNGAMPLYDLFFLLVLVFLKILLAIYIAMLWINEYYEIWPGAVLHKKGFFFRKEERHPFSQMRSVKIDQGFFGKIFGFGTISLYNWYLKTNTSLYLIHNPVKYFHIIEDLLPKGENERQIFLDEDTVAEEA